MLNQRVFFLSRGMENFSHLEMPYLGARTLVCSRNASSTSSISNYFRYTLGLVVLSSSNIRKLVDHEISINARGAKKSTNNYKCYNSSIPAKS